MGQVYHADVRTLLKIYGALDGGAPAGRFAARLATDRTTLYVVVADTLSEVQALLP